MRDDGGPYIISLPPLPLPLYHCVDGLRHLSSPDPLVTPLGRLPSAVAPPLERLSFVNADFC